MKTKIFSVLLGITSLLCSASFASAAEVPEGYVLVPASVFFGENDFITPTATSPGLSVEKSSVRINDEISYVGEAYSVATITLRDTSGRPISGTEVSLISSRATDAIESLQLKTSSNGEAVFRIVASQEGVSTLTAITKNQTLLERPRVVFLQKAGGIGGSLLRTEVLDAITAEAEGAMTFASQAVVDFAESVDTNTPSDITISIKDVTGGLVESFEGVVEFKSSDPLAILPQSYTFIGLDRGTHTFANAVTFSTTGEQTISVSGDSDLGAQEIIVSVGTGDDNPDATSPTVMSPLDGELLNDAVTVSGLAPTNANLVVFVDGGFFQDTDSDESGNFSVDVVLSDGEHEITVGTLNGGGSVGAVSEAITILLDQTKPIINSISLEPNNRVVSGETVGVEIKSEPRLSNVQLRIGDELVYLDELATLGTYHGEFSVSAAGAYFAKVELEDAAGNIGKYPDATSLMIEAAITINSISLTSQDSRVDLRWNAPANTDRVTNYEIFYGEHEDSLSKKLETSNNSTAWFIDELSNDHQYFFRVVSINALGEENGSSETFSATPVAPAAPAVEASPVATQICNSRIVLRWDAKNSKIANYRLDYGVASGDYSESRLLPNGASRDEWEVRDLLNNTEYFFALRGIDDFGAVVMDFDEASATPRSSAVCASSDPVQLFQRTDADGNMILFWNAVQGATSYRIHAGTQPNIYDLATVEVASTAFRPDGLLANEDYYFAVSAVFSGMHETATLSNVVKVEVGPAEILLISALLALSGAFWIRRTKTADRQS